MSIYTDSSTSVDVQVSEGNKWYSYVLPKDKGLFRISGNTVNKVVVKANITTSGETIIPYSTVEASFKGSNTSKVTYMGYMFQSCHNLTSLDVSNFNTSNVTNMGRMFYNCTNLATLDLSGWDMSNVTSMSNMFNGCSKLTTIRMVDCSQDTRTKIQEQLTTDLISIDKVNIITE